MGGRPEAVRPKDLKRPFADAQGDRKREDDKMRPFAPSGWQGRSSKSYLS